MKLLYNILNEIIMQYFNYNQIDERETDDCENFTRDFLFENNNLCNEKYDFFMKSYFSLHKLLFSNSSRTDS